MYVGVALRPPPVAEKGSKALSEITSNRKHIYVQRIATIFQTGKRGSPLHCIVEKVTILRSGIICVKSHRFYNRYDWRSLTAATDDTQPSYKQKRSGNNVLHFANLLPDHNFPFSIFNFTFN